MFKKEEKETQNIRQRLQEIVLTEDIKETLNLKKDKEKLLKKED
jgi:hypothetical protein